MYLVNGNSYLLYPIGYEILTCGEKSFFNYSLKTLTSSYSFSPITYLLELLKMWILGMSSSGARG